MIGETAPNNVEIIGEPILSGINYIAIDQLPEPVGWLIISQSKCDRCFYKIGLYQKPNAIRRWILKHVLGFDYEDKKEENKPKDLRELIGKAELDSEYKGRGDE